MVGVPLYHIIQIFSHFFGLWLIVGIINIKSFAQITDYGFYKEITIDFTKVSGSNNLINFPVLISLMDPNLRTTANGGNVENANGYDIVFGTDISCNVRIDHEIEKYVATTGEYIAWVRVPTLSYTANTKIYMYYGNISVSADPSVTTTWDLNYKGIWHLKESSGIRKESTSNNNDITDVNTVGSATGWIGTAASFIAANSEVLEITDAAQTGLDITGNLTIGAWFNTNSIIVTRAFASKSGAIPQHTYHLRISGSSVVTLILSNDGTATTANNTDAISTSIWYYAVGVYNGSNMTTYLNGVANTPTSYSLGIFDGTGPFNIGARGSNQFFDGLIDEVRVSDIDRSAGWILTEYNNQNSPSTFYSVGDQTVSCSSPLPIELLSFNAYCNNQQVILEWNTVTEFNNDYFSIERSTDASTWEKIGTVQGAGNSSTIRSYEFVDSEFFQYPIPTTQYYRIKQTDYDGENEYYAPISVNIANCNENLITVLPTISGKEYFTVTGKGKAELEIYSLQGQKVFSAKDKALPFCVDLSANCGNVYLIRIKTEKEHFRKIVINK